MKVFCLKVDYDADGNCPWGMLRADGALEDSWPLYDSRPLARAWKPMFVTLHDVEEYAEFVYFTAGGWAVRPEARRLLEPVVGEAAEFLPLECDKGDEFFALHPLQLAELGPDADAHQNRISKNITTVRRYSFDAASIAGMACFRARQPVGSAAGPNSGCSDVLVSDTVQEHIAQSGFRGICCVPAFPIDERWEASRTRRST